MRYKAELKLHRCTKDMAQILPGKFKYELEKASVNPC